MPLRHRLRDAYQRTHYCVQTPRGELLLRPGDREPRTRNLGRWVILSADNPRSRRLRESWNSINFNQLKRILSVNKYQMFHGLNRDPEGRWPDERSLMICGIALPEAMKLGQRFGQNALLAGEPGHRARLVWL